MAIDCQTGYCSRQLKSNINNTGRLRSCYGLYASK